MTEKMYNLDLNVMDLFKACRFKGGCDTNRES